MKGAYTDFHIDLSGSNVWFRVLSGKKCFLLIAPGNKTYEKFRAWMDSPSKSTTFLPLLMNEEECCYQYELCPGETLILPSGWLHAVYTPEKSVAVGGNFLQCASISRQIQVNQQENMMGDDLIHQFPGFRLIHWYLLCSTLPAVYNKVFNTKEEIVQKEDNRLLSAVLMLPDILRQIPILLVAMTKWIDELSKKDRRTYNDIAEKMLSCTLKNVMEKWQMVIMHTGEAETGLFYFFLQVYFI